MIVILAGNYIEAKRWADFQELEDGEWVFPIDESHLMKLSNFHTIVIGTAGLNVPESYFNSIYNLAKKRGRIGRTS